MLPSSALFTTDSLPLDSRLNKPLEILYQNGITELSRANVLWVICTGDVSFLVARFQNKTPNVGLLNI